MKKNKTIVVKLGTSVLTGNGYHLDTRHMVELVRQCALMMEQGHKIILVSSGAIAAGRSQLINHNENDNYDKDVLAAVGQSNLIQTWQTLFNLYNIPVGQMLLTRADLEDRERYLRAKHTLNSLLKHNILPIVNENDAVCIEEIKVGDNDNLSALTAILAQAKELYLLTDQPGLFSSDPRKNKDAQLISTVSKIDNELKSIAGGSGSDVGTGGMATKLEAAEIATRSGIEVIIAKGRQPNVIIDLANDKPVGTRFTVMDDIVEGRKQWLLAGPASNGCLVVDDGAQKAIFTTGSSLLAKGILDIKGQFNASELVEIKNVNNVTIARGISCYSSNDLLKIKGLHSENIEQKLGYLNGSAVIHRDDLVILDVNNIKQDLKC
ncbi:glutamate 5-kinase [Pseudoalteromonas denitrificans]|uniref:Glutamate 5-kinase n=1 Tax=Pseudoalteromonas denitrificans DSM 6059 TaxID=1123010 RepID=A0A1I1G0R6_9GAMM|nr:glutamate 5-kinase [Pseudoalteromonas denitrificans]SFC05125.1 glutamate 5-kinase [Pseudoalteromonas denitrificans DSM 6059]